MCREHAWDGEACPYCRIEELKAEVENLLTSEQTLVDELAKAEAERDDANSRAAYWGEEHAKGTADSDRLRGTIKIIFDNSINPDHTMTMLGLTEVTDANFKIANEALNPTEPLPAHSGCCDICDTGGCCKEESEEA